MEFDRFLEAPEEFYYECLPIHSNPHRPRRRRLPHHRKLNRSEVETEPSNGVEFDENLSYVEVNEDDDEEETILIDDLLLLSSPEIDITNNNQFQDESCITEEKKPEEESTLTLTPSSSSSHWSLLGLVGFQFNLMISFIKFPLMFLYRSTLFFIDPFSTIITNLLGQRYLTTIINLFNFLSLFKDPKQILNVVCKFGWGFFWAVYVGIVLFGFFVSSFMFAGFMINCIAHKPFLVKHVLNFDYTKNSPEVYLPITSCTGVVACVDGSCKESNEMHKIRGLRAIPRGHKLEITLSMTLPESSYNKNLGMFQVRVDSLSADGQTLASIRRPCMLQFRSEPIRLVQTFFKMVPLVTGYVSEIQTLSLKLKGFVEKDIPTACLKVMIEQRAEFRPGAGIPELYDASLSLESDLPFFKKNIWKWRKTLYVWMSMSVFITELLFTLVCCRSLIIPRTQRRERPHLRIE